jgi:hypothetical protein
MSDRSRRLWLTGVAALLTAFAVARLPLPDGLDPASSNSTRLFAALGSATFVLLVILPGIVFRALTSRRPLWLAAAAVLLVCGGVAFWMHGTMQRACTARYDGRSVIVGTEWTTLGRSYATTNPALTKDDLLFDAAGVADRLWTRTSIDGCRSRIALTYFLWVPLFAAGLTALVHTIPSGTLPVGSRARTAPGSPEPPTLRYDVFISYRHGGRDGAFAHELLAALERCGYPVAIDERDFPANASFLQEMERSIRESRFTVSIISARYLDSGHCEEEAILCKVLDMGDRRRRLIPMVIDAVTMPAWLFGIVGIDCTKPEPLVDPFDKLRTTLGPPLAAGRASSPST